MLLVTHHPGIYRRSDGEMFRVQFARNFAKVYSQRLLNGKWTYEPLAISTLTADMLLSLDDARVISRELGQCLACGSMLSDEKSLAAGIGPSCAKAWTIPPKRAYRVVTQAEIDAARERASQAYEAERSARARASVRARLDGDRVVITSGYDDLIVSIIGTTPGARWDADRRWSIPKSEALALAEAFEVAGMAHDDLANIGMGWVA